MSASKVTLYGVGDVSAVHEPAAGYDALIRSAMAKADIRFAASERCFSDRGTLQLNVLGNAAPLPPRMADVFDGCGFDVVSAGSNHVADWGYEAMLDTRDVLRAKGMQVIGVGEDIEEACRPAFVERNGVRVAFLSFCSILRDGCEAGPGKPGVAPMRARTYYEPINYQPGAPARIITIPRADDLAAMTRHVAAAKRRADVVVLSLHWGVAIIPRLIADYQRTVAEAGFAAGADIILGHHAHVPKAIGVHGGKACFYSLGNFIVTSRHLVDDPERQAAFARDNGITIDPHYPLLPFGADAKRSLIAKAVLTPVGVESVSFLPVELDRRSRPELLSPDDPRFGDSVRYMEWVSEGFPHRFTPAGDEILVTAE